MAERPGWPWFPFAVWPFLLAAALLLGLLGWGDDFQPDRALTFWVHVAATLGLSGWIWCLPARLAWPRRLALAGFGWLTAVALLGIVAPWSSSETGALAALLAWAAIPVFVGALLAGLAPGSRAVCAVFLPILWWTPLALSFAGQGLGLEAVGSSLRSPASSLQPPTSGLRSPVSSPSAPRVLEAAPLSAEGGYRRGRVVLGGSPRAWRGELELRSGLRTWRWSLDLETGGTRALLLHWLDEGEPAAFFLRSEDGGPSALDGAEPCLTGSAAPPVSPWPDQARLGGAAPAGLRRRLLSLAVLILPLGWLAGALWWRGSFAAVIVYALVLPLGWSWVWPGPPVLRLAVDQVLLRPGSCEMWHREALEGLGRPRELAWRLRPPWPAPEERAAAVEDQQRDELLRLRLRAGQIRRFYAPARGPAPSLRPAGPGRWIIENPTAAALWLRPDGDGPAIWLGAGDASEWRPGNAPGAPARLSGLAEGLAAAENGLPPGERLWLWEVIVND